MGGEPSVTDSETYLDEGVEGKAHARLLAALRAVEENSSHPIAKAIVAYCKVQTSELISAGDVEEIPGKGLKALCSGNAQDESFNILVGMKH